MRNPVFHLPLLRLLLVNALVGAALAIGFVVALLWLDPANIGSLLLKDHSPAVAFLVLAGSFVITFSSLMMGSAVMMLPKEEPKDPTGLKLKVLTPLEARRHVQASRGAARG